MAKKHDLPIYVFDKNLTMKAVLENKVGSCFYFDAVHTEDLQGGNSFEFTCSNKHRDSKYVEGGAYVAFKDLDGDYQLFNIITVDEEGEHIKHVTAQHAIVELTDEVVFKFSKTNANALECLLQVVRGTEWRIGACDVTVTRYLEIGNTNALDALHEIATTFGADLRYRVEIVGNKVTRKYVDLLKQRGSVTGKRFEYGKDIISVRRSTDTADIKTAIYGYGEGAETETGDKTRLTFADIEWSKAKGDPLDKPLGQQYLEDPEAKANYGRVGIDGQVRNRFAFFEDGRIKDVEFLIRVAYERLMEINKPRVTYELNVLELERIAGLKHEAIRLGDGVNIIDYEFEIPLKDFVRIIEVKRYLLEPEKTEVTMGNFRVGFSSSIDEYERMRKLVDENQGIWEDKLSATDFNHWVEFGILDYKGTGNQTLEFQFSQAYEEIPVMNVHHQLGRTQTAINEDIDIQWRPMMLNDRYIGGEIFVNRSGTAELQFNIVIQAYCTAPNGEEQV